MWVDMSKKTSGKFCYFFIPLRSVHVELINDSEFPFQFLDQKQATSTFSFTISYSGLWITSYTFSHDSMPVGFQRKQIFSLGCFNLLAENVNFLV